MMTKEGEGEVGVNPKMVVSSECVDETSSSVSEKRTPSNIAAGSGSSITIDQMVRDFIIAKKIGMNGNDRGGDSAKVEQDRKGHHKSNKDKKKKKKKKKKHKSHHRESSSKHHSHRHRDRRSDASSNSNSSDESRQQCVSNEAVVVEGKRDYAEHGANNNDGTLNDGPLTHTKKIEESSETNKESVACTETLSNFSLCSKCSGVRQIIAVPESEQQKTKTDDVQCHCVSPVKGGKMVSKNETCSLPCEDDTTAESTAGKSNKGCLHHTISVSDSSGKHVVNETSQAKVRTAGDSQHSREAVCRSHKENTSSHKHSNETRKLTKHDDRHDYGVSSQSRHFDSNKVSDIAKKQHSSREQRCHREGTGYDKPTNSRKSSPSLEKGSDKHSLLIEDGKSDDVVFVKKVSYNALKSSSSREAVASREKSNTQQKWKSSQSIAVSDSSKHGSKRRYDSESSNEDTDFVPECKSKRSGRQTRDSPVILLSDDDVDALSDEMMEKLHKRLTTSIKKSKEMQAERELNLVVDLKTDVSATSHNTELTGQPVCCEAVSPSAYSEIILPADSPPHGAAVSTGEQSAVKATASGLLGKKPLKFGLKISESSAAWISKGIKNNNQGAGKKVLC